MGKETFFLKLLYLQYSLRLNAELPAREWVILGFLVLGVQIILQVVILIFYEHFKILTKKIAKKV